MREKDLDEAEYKEIAAQVMEISERHGVLCILHSFVKVAIQLKAQAVHLPLTLLNNMSEEEKSKFLYIGASCHSVSDALSAQKLGCTYITAGHVFSTDCKKGVPPRGLGFLSEVCRNVEIPVYAIGGISKNNISEVCGAGARGGCVMSGFMQCENAAEYTEALKNEL